MNIVGLSDVTILAKNIAEERDFFVKVGFEVVFGNEKLVVLRAGAQELAIHKSGQAPRGT